MSLLSEIVEMHNGSIHEVLSRVVGFEKCFLEETPEEQSLLSEIVEVGNGSILVKTGVGVMGFSLLVRSTDFELSLAEGTFKTLPL